MDETPRPGQKAALDTIIARFARGESYTAIVLPTRYGKSDVIRIATLVAVEQRLIACSLVMSPTGFLVKQLLKADKWDKCLARFDAGWLKENGYAPLSFRPKYSRLDRVKVNPNANGEHLLSATVQLIDRNTDIFCEWIESVRHQTGLPVAVFMDESHTGSDANQWGKTLKQLAAAGALIVLLTATAERADGETIPGFHFDEITTDPVTVRIPRPGSEPELIRVDVYEGIERRLRLRADHETSFRAAFQEDALAKISYTPIDVDLSEVAAGSFSGWLSELPPGRVPAALDKCVRHPAMIKRGVEFQVRSLRQFRTTVPRALGIVFSGNDDARHGARKGDNQHAELIKAEYLRQAPDLSIVILTAQDADAEDQLIAFCDGGRADVAIVKQMGSLGLDSKLLKVGLDLSTIRTYTASVQRTMRVATPPPLVSHWITPDDVLARANFQRVVTDQGGEAKIADLTWLEAYEVERKEKVKEVWRVGSVLPGDFDDSQNYHGSREEWPVVQQILAGFPAIRSTYTDAYIAHQARNFQLQPVPTDEGPVAEDTGAQADALCIEINQIGDDATDELFRQRGRPYGSYGDLRGEIFGHAKGMAGWPRADGKFIELGACSNVRKLRALRDAIQAVYSRILNGSP